MPKATWTLPAGFTSLLASLFIVGCGSGGTHTSPALPTGEPLTHREQLVQRGAGLFVSDGCSACHQISGGSADGPSFARFAGHRVRLTDGKQVLVDERFLRRALLAPSKFGLKGYPLAPMLEAIERLHLNHHPEQVAALVAFIEQVGPETG